ncbi:putative xyloglucan endotransglucosylase/hydrolase 6 -like protein [Gossypium arboreum]|uniref:Putative xyloglucan endotransglucosylase/hydrolase 6-like protein n=1 Tax=Gossypium arboreum TaxID=29729 RepID=A0A0B0MU25_GOSAR|nr:putative xyloglucan endotransglucosylase/hydrolase 6 -like protein [Gossypium arboreum]
MIIFILTSHCQILYTFCMYLNWIHIHLIIYFSIMPVELFKNNKHTRIARKARTIPTSQTRFYM